MEMQSGFWLMIAAVAVFGVAHSIMASMWLKGIIAGCCKKNFERFYRLLYNLVATVTLLPVLGLVLYLPDKELYRIPFPWALLTMAIQGLCLWGMVVTMGRSGTGRFLGIDQFLAIDPSEQTEELVVDGWYYWVRHPIYLFSLFFIWLMPMMSMNVLGLNIGLTIYLFIGTLLEERKLEAAFGETYVQYKQKTPMILPIRFSK
ncbi:MAG: isoprenylcysteine carboxylmethyltransferase family protein [Anaerolineaceae bacterium]|nr:isoprenylcysteine carboxylmethyltransferase family protein [Anaerolineaceae bacterium]